MAIQSKCPGCGRTLQVAEEHLGKQARCPVCNEIYQVSKSETPMEGTRDGGQWRMRTPEGQTYGPVTKKELDAWVNEGRVTADCLISSEHHPNWVNADTVYTVLQPRIGDRIHDSLVNADTVYTVLQPAADPSPAVSPRPASRYVQSHRGGLILALGIISWAVGCPIFGICAWVMGNSDLREMRAGRMDTSGMGLTQAGQIVGMIHALLSIMVIVLVVFLFLLGIGWR